jgi:flavin-dependent dehydrogenase
MTGDDVDVAVVGGGPAGAVTASLLGRRGWRVVVFERALAWRWRACGVFTSPAAVAVLRRVGLAEQTIHESTVRIPAMNVEAGGATVRLTYGDDGSLRAPAVGFDRARLDPALLDLATTNGVNVRSGCHVTSVVFDGPPQLRLAEGRGTVRPRVVIGADGIRSVVARAAGVARPAPLGQRVGLTFHVADPRRDRGANEARMVVLDGAYCGLAPVPGGRLNVGIVLAGRDWRARLARGGAETVARDVLRAASQREPDGVDLAAAERCDSIQGAAPLGHRVARRAGDGWLLVGDAAGFLDPFTGEGLHRAIVSAELAADAIDAHLRGGRRALDEYDRRMTARFRAKDAVSIVVQAFLERPAAFRYAARRLARRDRLRETMGLVMGDLLPASRALDPRFLAAVLWP